MKLPAASLLCCLLLTGCVLSIDAVVPASDATFDPRLLGEWQGESGRERAVIARDSGGAYAIAYTDDKGKRGTFRARLGRLGPKLVLDVWPAPDDATVQGPVADALVPGHVLLALEIGPDSLVVRSLDPDSLDAALRSRAVRLTSSEVDDQLVLHGTTAQLRAALAPWFSRAGAWHEPGTWRRPTGAGLAQPVEPPCFEAAPWREADALFHRDPRWLGSDVGSTVDLGGGRTLWLFGDSWIDPSGRGDRRASRMVSNTLAIQSGADPSTASIAFYWGRKADGGPDAYFPDRRGERLWFGNGIRVEDRLVLFLGRVVMVRTGLGFESAGWTAFLVENPDTEPSAWRVREIATPTNPLGVTVGFAGTWRDSGYVYAFGGEDPVKSHPQYVARWRDGDVRRGDLMRPEWWAGERLGWVPDSSATPRWPLFENGQSELTIHYDRASGRYLEVQSMGFGPADVMLRAAVRLTGPWSAPRMIYRPPEYYQRDIMIYAAKAHPTLAGADLVLTYATNSFRPDAMSADTLIYYPRFVRLTRCR